jgi:hypothetical protein
MARESAPGEAAGEPPAPATQGSEASPVREPPLPGAGSPAAPLQATGPKLPARYGLAIQFRSRPGDDEVAQLVDTVVWVNDAHPAYRRAVLSRSEGYHLALAVALALAPLAAEPVGQLGFVTAFLAHWGDAVGKPRRPGKGRDR